MFVRNVCSPSETQANHLSLKVIFAYIYISLEFFAFDCTEYLWYKIIFLTKELSLFIKHVLFYLRGKRANLLFENWSYHSNVCV